MNNSIDLAFCSICTMNYISYVATLNDSLKKFYPKINHYVLVIDYEDIHKKLLEKYDFKVILIKQLSIPNIRLLIKKYNAFELSNILKPFFFEWILKTSKIEMLFYFDSDIRIYSTLEHIIKYFKKTKHSVLLTPHIHSYVNESNNYKIEKLLMLSGLYNGGFYALKNDKNCFMFLEWHKRKLEKYGYNAPYANMFVDQKILDFAPLMFNFVGIYKNNTYNIGHWNYKNYKLKITADSYFVNEGKLVFFHFSQIKFRMPIAETVMFGKKINNDLFLQKIIYDYWRALLKNGYKETRLIQYGLQKYYKGATLPVVDPIAFRENQINILKKTLNITLANHTRLEKENTQLNKVNAAFRNELNKVYNSKYYRLRVMLYKIKSLFKYLD